ncbi:hypothetical protein A2U01_0056524, partial [Trifolium medium]|nr:hypothetical protein [Trifolium medium]
MMEGRETFHKATTCGIGIPSRGLCTGG